MRRKFVLLTTGMLLLLRLSLSAQQPTGNDQLSQYFSEAYSLYPNLPKGLLEATAYSASRMDNLHATESETTNCLGMPLQYGLFGLVEDGKGYFKNTLTEVSALSNITPDQFKKDVRLQVLAVAKYLSKQSVRQSVIEDFAPILEDLSGIPEDGSSVNTFARKSHTFDIFMHLQKGFTTPAVKLAPRTIQLKKIYPDATLRVLQSPGVELSFDKDKVVTHDGTRITTTANTTTAQGIVSANSEMEIQSADYPPAIWNPAASCNYGAGRSAAITHVGIHTTQGSYAGTISWFKNCSAGVSAHYVIRSSDGQVTQMVSETNTAWHIGNNNSYTIGIEHEGFVTDPAWYTEAMYQSSAALTRDICDSRGIDRNSVFRGPATGTYNPITNDIHIKGHQHYNHPSHHVDPGANWNWGKYADLLKPFIIIPNGTYRITHAITGRVLDAQGCSGNNGTLPNIWDWYGADCQRWSFEHTGDGWYKITCRLGGRALDNDRCLPNDGNKIQLWDWLNNDCQRWRIEDWGNGTVRLVNKSSGKLLDVSNDGRVNGSVVFQWSATGANAQRWTLQPVSANYIADGTYRIRLARNNKVLQSAAGNDTRGIAMSKSDWLDSSYQKWRIENTPDGWYKFSSPNGFAMDVENCNATEGGKVMLWDWLNNDCQRWSLSAIGNGQYNIVSKASGKALDAPSDNEYGDLVYQWTWINNENQQWFIEVPPVGVAAKASISQLSLAPNPVTTGTQVQLVYKSDVAQPASIIISDIYGRPVLQRSVTVQKGINRFTLPTGALQPGIYHTTIKAINSRNSESKRIIVVK